MKWTRYTDDMGQKGYRSDDYFVYKPEGTNYWCVQELRGGTQDNPHILWAQDFPTLREAKEGIEDNLAVTEFINSFLGF